MSFIFKIILLYIKVKLKYPFKQIIIKGITREKKPPLILLWYDIDKDPSTKTMIFKEKNNTNGY
jgi:hypothetical protein